MSEAEDKTSAISLADLGMLDENDATVSVDASAIKARAQQVMAAQEDSEKTTAFNVADLPPEDDAPRQPQKTLLGHPAPRPGAAVRGGAAPQKRQETLAIAPASVKQAATQYEDADKTSALSLDDIEKIDQLTAPPKPAAKAAPAAMPPRANAPAAKPVPKPAPAQAAEEEKTTAFSLDDIDSIDAAPAPKKGSAAAKVEEVDEERTVAVMDDGELAAMQAKMAARAQQAKKSAADIEAELDDEPMPAKKGAPAKKDVAPAKKAAAAAPAAKKKLDIALPANMEAAEGFFGSIGHFLAYDGIVAKQNAGLETEVQPDDEKKAAGFRNIIIVGGALAALIVVFGIIW